MIRSTVLLPLPEGPSSTQSSPAGTVSEKSATTGCRSYRLVRPWTQIDTGCPAGSSLSGGHGPGQSRRPPSRPARKRK